MSLITQKRVYVIISTKIMAPILFESYNKFKKEKIESRHTVELTVKETTKTCHLLLF